MAQLHNAPDGPSGMAGATPSPRTGERLSPPPDLGSTRRQVLAAALVALAVAVILALRAPADLAASFSDSDDALRMAMVRRLLGGAGWYDQLIQRLQPPVGLLPHWSRLIDGGIAGLERLFGLLAPSDAAEFMARFIWPMLWIFPAVLAVVLIAARLGGSHAVFAAGVLLIADKTLYLQFVPGRIDHHGPQIALCAVACWGAAARSPRGALIAGVATGLGLAIGLEAIVFEAIAGAFVALAFALDEKDDGRRLRAYGAGLGLTALGAFLVQTPPSRWTVPVCDALGANLAAGIVIAAAGLFVLGRYGRVPGRPWRLAGLAVVAAASAGTVLALHPSCAAGPFADVDPSLKRFWLADVQEIQPLARIWAYDHETVFLAVATWICGAAAWLWLGRGAEGRGPAWRLGGALLLAAIVASAGAMRMAAYAEWIAAPLIAAAVADALGRFGPVKMAPLAVAVLAATPTVGATAASAADAALHRTEDTGAFERSQKTVATTCLAAPAYRRLAEEPPGLVLAETDLGPFVLAYTSHSALAAPYHRMQWGMLAQRRVLMSDAEAAGAEARRLGVRYVVQCPAYATSPDRARFAPGSLQKRLDRDQPPGWLERAPAGEGALRVYRVRPPAAD